MNNSGNEQHRTFQLRRSLEMSEAIYLDQRTFSHVQLVFDENLFSIIELAHKSY